MSSREREDWEGATDEELGDGIDDGNEDAVREYGSRLFHQLQQAKALLRRWARKTDNPTALASLRYETVSMLDGPEAARALALAAPPLTADPPVPR